MAQEKSFENKVKNYLKANGCYFVKFFANSFTKSGVPDILSSCNGFFLAIEVKASNGHPSELQIYNRDEIRKSGGISIILYPEQFEDFKLLVQDLINYPSHIDTIRTEQKTFDRRIK